MRGLLMIEQLYHQTVAGRKTQTRRAGGLEAVNEDPDNWTPYMQVNVPAENINRAHFFNTVTEASVVCKPRYQVGEALYLKEPYWANTKAGIVYQFDLPLENRHHYPWKNKLFMPAAFARQYVKITAVDCERLLDISEADCLAEGIQVSGYMSYLLYRSGTGTVEQTEDARESFFSLFRYANKMGNKKEIPNLWVWKYTFELVK